MSTASAPRTPPLGGDQADGACLTAEALGHDVRLAMQQLAFVQHLAATRGCHAVTLCDAHAEVGRALASVQAFSLAAGHLAVALQWAEAMAARDSCADLQCALAEAAAGAADQARARRDSTAPQLQARARERALEAAALAAQATDPYWEVRVLLRASDVLDRCGEHADAVQLQQRALVLMGVHDRGTALADATATAGGEAVPPLSLPAMLM